MFCLSHSLAKCSKIRNTLTTFNHKRYNYEIPLSCIQILVQDYNSEHEFIVLMKKDDVLEHEDLNIKVADMSDIVQLTDFTSTIIHK